MTDDAFAFVTGPESVGDFTGEAVSRSELGGSGVHDRRNGRRRARRARRGDRPRRARRAPLVSPRPPPRRSATLGDATTTAPARAASPRPRSPTRPSASYDVRDRDRRRRRRRLAPRAARRVRAEPRDRARDARRAADRRRREPARAPRRHASTSRRPARRLASSRGATTFNLPIVTLVDTPGFEPGRDLEWRGHDPPRRRARARLRGGDRSPAVRRDAQGLRRRVHRHGLAWASATTSRRVAGRADRGDGRPARSADPARQAAACRRTRRRAPTPSASSSRSTRPSSTTPTAPPSAASSTR